MKCHIEMDIEFLEFLESKMYFNVFFLQSVFFELWNKLTFIVDLDKVIFMNV